MFLLKKKSLFPHQIVSNVSVITTFESVCLLFNISIEANSVDPDQTALGEQSALDLHCLFKRLHNISIDDKNIRLCCNIRFKG